MNKEACIAVLGLGYVGPPLAVEFSKHYDVLGFDINYQLVQEPQAEHERTREVSDNELQGADRLEVSSDEVALKKANVYIVTAPASISEHKELDSTLLLAASSSIGKALSEGDTVIYESTVCPGATAEQYVPVLEKFSGSKLKRHFTVGYSPGRINPGDNKHRLQASGYKYY